MHEIMGTMGYETKKARMENRSQKSKSAQVHNFFTLPYFA